MTFSFPVTLTFDLQTSNLLPIVSLVQRYVSTIIRFYGFPVSRKSEARDGRTCTDGQMDGPTDGRYATLNATP